MGRNSPTKTCIVIYCDPNLYARFYALRKEFNRLERNKHSNKEFLRFLVEVGEMEISRRRFRLRSY
ncbi:MAG: hypothetical protein QXR62_04610 [Candidatus Bathyarchaeia archaeon]